MFDNSGKFVKCFRLPPFIDDNGKELSTENWKVKLATDINDNIYVLVEEKNHQLGFLSLINPLTSITSFARGQWTSSAICVNCQLVIVAK